MSPKCEGFFEYGYPTDVKDVIVELLSTRPTLCKNRAVDGWHRGRHNRVGKRTPFGSELFKRIARGEVLTVINRKCRKGVVDNRSRGDPVLSAWIGRRALRLVPHSTGQRSDSNINALLGGRSYVRTGRRLRYLRDNGTGKSGYARLVKDIVDSPPRRLRRCLRCVHGSTECQDMYCR